MLVGVPKEIKPQENRVGLIPAGVRQLVSSGNQVIVEQNAGSGSGIPDAEYIAAGAEIVSTPEEVWSRAEMIWKVKEPIAPEYPRLRDGQILYTYLHLAPDRPQTDALLNAGVIGIAYETVQDLDGSLPLLTPMSEVAGRLSVQAGAPIQWQGSEQTSPAKTGPTTSAQQRDNSKVEPIEEMKFPVFRM